MSGGFDLAAVGKRKTVKLTTIGRRSGEPRSVTIWFVVDGPRSILVQHVAKKPAMWHRNLAANPSVQVDFGDGAMPGTASVIESADEIRDVIKQVGKKYWMYRIIRFFGGNDGDAVAARIVLDD